ncbi:hypothetical protein [Paraliomyxa miuraensis]|uniref:hypothetical protein n=1 Tax=Paraliomyxa miuraensis TaxID=376150 RepID=UPI00224C930A|nr:hypothetical protein [Paraliomyxa miuraensis]MCX4243427.1 hypothetical protein [Paraliomyxa miuraensis]
MAINDELHHLGNSARRLNAGSDQLNGLIERIDELLAQLSVGLDYVHPRPIDEATSLDHNGKRVIELSYVGYLRAGREYHLALKTVKVLESKLALATHSPGDITPLLSAPRRLRYAAVDLLPEVISGLAAQVDEMAAALERRCHTAQSLVRHLEQVAARADESGVRMMTMRPDESGSRRVVPPDESGLRRTMAPDESASRHVLVPGEPLPGGESSGQWVVPKGMGTATTVMPTQADDGRRTVAMGSDLIKHRDES